MLSVRALLFCVSLLRLRSAAIVIPPSPTSYISSIVSIRAAASVNVALCWPDYFARVGSELNTCSLSQEYINGVCYAPCASGYTSTNSPVCTEVCLTSYTDSGNTCASGQSSYEKKTYARIGAPFSDCTIPKQKVGRLCYDPCPSGYTDKNVICMASCSGLASIPCGFACVDKLSNCNEYLASATEFYSFSKKVASIVANIGGFVQLKSTVRKAMNVATQIAVESIRNELTREDFISLMTAYSFSEGESPSSTTLGSIYSIVSKNGGLDYKFNYSPLSTLDWTGIPEMALGFALDYCGSPRLPTATYLLRNNWFFYLSIDDFRQIRNGIQYPSVAGDEGMTIEYSGKGHAFISRAKGGNKYLFGIDDTGKVIVTEDRSFDGFADFEIVYYPSLTAFSFQRFRSPRYVLACDRNGRMVGTTGIDITGWEAWYVTAVNVTSG